MRFGLSGAAGVIACVILAGCTATRTPPPAPASLTIVSWNLEHLATENNSGCRPRTDTDYASLAGFAAKLNADVIAFQEVESLDAARRVFPPDQYTIVMEERPGTGSGPPCYGAPALRLNRQALGFAIRNGIAFERHPDVTALQLDDPNLRSGVDVTITPQGAAPLRLLTVHLKSGCAGGGTSPSCETVAQQGDILVEWAQARSASAERFGILGDFNKRLALPGDALWAKLDDPPGDADLINPGGTRTPQCDPRYTSFIDHILLNITVTALVRFEEWTFDGARLSDHCPISATLTPAEHWRQFLRML